jgi:hypothetical protein
MRCAAPFGQWIFFLLPGEASCETPCSTDTHEDSTCFPPLPKGAEAGPWAQRRMTGGSQEDWLRRRGIGAWPLLWLMAVCLVPCALRAQVGPPAHAYLYLGAYEGRFECLVGVPELMEMLGRQTSIALPPGAQQEVRDAALAAAQKWLRVKLDGTELVSLAPPTASLVKGVPGRTERPAPDELLVATQTMVGFTWEFDLEAVPKNIEITWEGFRGAWTSLPVTVIVGSQSENFELTSGYPSNLWKNQGRLSLRTPLAEVPVPSRAAQIKIPAASLLWLGLGFVFFGLRHISGGRVPGRAFMTWMTLIAGAVVLWPVMNVPVSLPQNEDVPPEQAEKILRALLRNTYRAFDQRSESAIYDQLDRSIHGDLLQKVYLQTIEALTLDEQDKTRVRVTDLDVQVSATQPRKEGRGFIADVRWTALGTVGHWGHEHQRVNRYLAKVTVAPVEEKSDGRDASPPAWKMVALDIQEERRL